MTCGGFTLIELLVVVGIIVVLAALLVPTLATYQRHAYEQRNRTLLALVAAGIDRYRQDHIALPPAPAGYADGSAAWAEACGAMLYEKLVSTGNDAKGNPRPGYLAKSLSAKQTADDRILDIYGKPLLYLCANAAGTWPWQVASPAAVQRPFSGNGTSFELWSSGPDGSFGDLRPDRAKTSDPDNDNLPARNYGPGVIR